MPHQPWPVIHKHQIALSHHQMALVPQAVLRLVVRAMLKPTAWQVRQRLD